MPLPVRPFARPWASLFRLLAAVVAAAVLAPAAQAQTYTWTEPLAGGSINWSAGTWSPSAPPSGGSTSTVLNFNVLNGSAASTFTNDIGAMTVNGINLNNSGANLLTLALGA